MDEMALDVPVAAAVDALPYSQPWYEAFRRSLGEGVCRQLGIYAIPDDLVLSVVIPVFNERETLLDLVEHVRAVPIRKQIVLVDDGSTDGTRDLLKSLEEPGQDDS